MGQLRNNPVDTRTWKEVIEHQTYIYNTAPMELIRCTGCGNPIKNKQMVTRLETSKGVEYYHYDKCLKGVELFGTDKA